MTDFNQNVNEAKDFLNLEEQDMKKLPQMLNVLTILTYIGCGLGVLGSVLGLLGMSFLNSVGSRSAEGAAVVSKVSNYATYSLLLGLAGIGLCFWGAVKMRNLQKQGFYIYVAGQVIPLIGSVLLAGSFGMAGASMFIGMIIPVVFIVLYATQLKEMH